MAPKDIEVDVDRAAIGAEPVRTHQDGRAAQKLDKTPTLVQNTVGSYKMVPKWLADELVGRHEVVLLKKTDPEYIDALKLALGVPDGFKKGEAVQMKGRAVKAEEIGAVDVAAIIRQAEAEVAALTKDDAPGVIIAAKELPAGAKGFQERLRTRGRKRGEE